ncbi:chemotaxis protein CheB [Polaromonas sp. CG_9.11]|uniref:chemotaxis protein CheB n=1 Tax=Polaromonas sp. CG_9.11 TaxID=2787730 RepID=UPI0018C9E28A|nr:chemotaxis protein CheB [Polaromonas sp. CG_9.11]MBG6075049.1 two-component system CheB/CheR fusion protein [Polaromonas sp. CG_9.11]
MADPRDASLYPENTDGLAKSTLNFPVVGIGASAGGLQALLRFFEQMPAANGMAFVIILHLSPEHESNVAQILQRVASMPVMQVNAPTAIQANHVYVIPPTHDLEMNDGHLQLSSHSRVRGAHLAIDLFFRTLAEVHQERAIAVVMSGTGNDGAAGLARVKEAGGVTLVQQPGDAEYDGMPKAAIATGMVDFVTTAAEMPQRLQELWANASRISLPQKDGPSLRAAVADTDEAARLAEDALRDIMSALSTYSKNDFRQYKRATVLRRIGRRLQVNGVPDLPAYRDFLRAHPEEVKLLLQDMLISVTNFFRDPAAFEALERDVLPALLAHRSPDEAVRVWVAGCATGEEAYSVAILLREQMELHHCTSELQIFATDIDERAVNVGRNALYPVSIATDVSPGRLKKFFNPEKEQFRVVKQMREKLLFAHHNVLRDPPFSRVDLICCRNLLIYLDKSAQSSVLETFRFALKPEGFLFLGTSESVEAANKLYTVFDKKSRFFKVNPNGSSIRHFLLAREQPSDRTVFSHRGPDRRAPKPASFGELHHKLIDQVVLPSVLIDSQHNILHLSENVGKFLLPGSGTPSVNLLDNTQAELRTELRTALYQAMHTGKPVRTHAVPVRRGNSMILVEMSVHSFGEVDTDSALALVMFEEVPEKPPALSPGNPGQAHQVLIEQLETEIRQLKKNLNQIIEQTEISTEELMSSNEEQQTVNEELRSATEELETSKEELQSINEELTTVNFELKVKVDETSMMNDDLQNLIASSDIATIFVDRSLHIKRFTPQATRIFNLIESDINRPLMDITHKLCYASLANDAAGMLKTLNPIERPVSSSDGRHYLAGIRPYRTIDDHIDGVVLTFVDVTELRKAEEKLRAGEERLRIAAETTKDYAILTIDEEGTITSWNVGAQRNFGYMPHEIVGQPFFTIFTPEDRAAGVPEDELRGAREEGRSMDERWHLRKDGSTFFCCGVVTRLEGKAGGYAKIARDMTESRSQQVSRDELLAMEKQANELKDQFLAVMSHELKHPLNLIQVNTELLLSHPEVRALPEVARAGETIRSAVVSQTKIIDDLLDLSRARTGKLTLRLAPVDLAEMATSIAAAAREAASKKSLTLNYEYSEKELVALCDRVRTEQVLWNLINNAIKFTPAGGIITVRLGRDGTFATVSVVDTGQGIDPAFLPHIFGMFIQAPDQKIYNTNTGLGVGLTLVRDLTVAQGGKVLADSEGIGKGTCFTIWLPLAQTRVQDKKAGLPSANLKGLRILVVDDMIDLLQPFSALLRLEGADVDMATSGQQALEMLEKNSYDLLISDLGMPYMDGYELIRKIRKSPDWRSLKAIALSGYGRQVDTVRALQSGFNAHLSKPATVAHICQSIAQLVPNKLA